MTPTAQSNENHEELNILAEENRLQTRTVIDTLKQQRDQANNALVTMAGEKAVLESRLKRTTQYLHDTSEKLARTSVQCDSHAKLVKVAQMANLNLDEQVKGMKTAIEMFYAEVESCCDIEELRKRLGIGEDEQEVVVEGEEPAPPKTFVQRFLAAFNRSSN
jgi:hypothetical protein